MKLPTQAELHRAASGFDADWGGLDEVLYGICSRSPGHSVRRDVTAKIALIDRAYSAGMERCVTPPPGEQAIGVITDFVCENAAEVDEIIACLAPLKEPLDIAAMVEIVGLHGRFTTLLRQVTTDGKTPRSFAAKYLHFHNPVVPIYDSYAAARLGKLVRWDPREIPFAQPPGGDAEYWGFCVRFFRLYDACRAVGLAASVKTLDTYLFTVPVAK